MNIHFIDSTNWNINKNEVKKWYMIYIDYGSKKEYPVLETFEWILPELDFTGIFTGIRNFLKYTTEKFGIPAANAKLCLVWSVIF